MYKTLILTGKISLVLAALTLITSCGDKPNTELSTLIQQRDSIKKEIDKLSEQYQKISEKITALDTEKRLTKVTILTAEPNAFNHYFRVQGSVESDQNVLVYPEMQGNIEKIHVKEGQQVSAGQILISLDSRVLQRNLEELQNSLSLAQTVFERQQRLWDQKIGSEIQYLEAQNNKTSLEKRIEVLRAQLSNAQIRAPFSGTIDEIIPRTGEMASPGMPVIRLINMAELYLTAEVSERYISRVKAGSKALISIPSMDIAVNGEVAQVGSFIEKANRSFKIRVKLENNADAQAILKPNLIAIIDILDFSADSAITIPSQLVLQSAQGESFVYLANRTENNVAKIEKAPVTTGLSYNGKTHITEGLSFGDNIVDKGARSITDSQLVEIVEL
ncbi:MAG: efflux RND transporter periplasmic adaptor subunit [Luteibaculaceae bacterium]